MSEHPAIVAVMAAFRDGDDDLSRGEEMTAEQAEAYDQTCALVEEVERLKQLAIADGYRQQQMAKISVAMEAAGLRQTDSLWLDLESLIARSRPVLDEAAEKRLREELRKPVPTEPEVPDLLIERTETEIVAAVRRALEQTP